MWRGMEEIPKRKRSRDAWIIVQHPWFVTTVHAITSAALLKTRGMDIPVNAQYFRNLILGSYHP